MNLASDLPVQAGASEPVLKPAGKSASWYQAGVDGIPAVHGGRPESGELAVNRARDCLALATEEHARTAGRPAEIGERLDGVGQVVGQRAGRTPGQLPAARRPEIFKAQELRSSLKLEGQSPGNFPSEGHLD
jgi:hypothetical protein